MSERTLTGIESVKKSSTAELRSLFEDIELLLKKGYNHKQICEQLNTQGLAISYPYYRVIMTRLRSERKVATTIQTKNSQPDRSAAKASPLIQSNSVAVHLNETEAGSGEEKKLSWNPGSEVKWK